MKCLFCKKDVFGLSLFCGSCLSDPIYKDVIPYLNKKLAGFLNIISAEADYLKKRMVEWSENK